MKRIVSDPARSPIRASLGLVLAMLGIGGCAPYQQVQIDLTDQVRRGVAMVAEAQASQELASQELHQLRRQMLDEAFDADVRARGDLSPEWVIEHRKAYAAALEVLDRARQARAASHESVRANLKAIDDALLRLRWLQSLPARLDPIFSEEP